MRVARPVLLCALAAASLAAGQTQYAPGIFVGTEHGPVELTAWAEPTRSGELRMAKNDLGNVPTIGAVTAILCNLRYWRPGAIVVASEAIFRDDRAERRQLPFAIRTLNLSAIEVRVSDLERVENLDQLRKSVRASDAAPAFVFVVMTTNGLERYYPFRLGGE
jgi:hypothetical protein